MLRSMPKHRAPRYGRALLAVAQWPRHFVDQAEGRTLKGLCRAWGSNKTLTP
jgi:hypothetical protein